MKKTIYGVAVLMTVLFASCNSTKEPAIWTLDLTNPTSTVEYDDNGLWKDTYNKQAAPLTAQCFTFQHYGEVVEVFNDDNEFLYSYSYYMGFVPCKNAEAKADNPEACVAKGGIKGEGTPYLIGYWGDFYDSGTEYRTCDITFNKGMADTYIPQEVYICNSARVADVVKNAVPATSYDPRAFKDGDYLRLSILALDENLKKVEGTEVVYYLADFRDGKTFVNEDWERIDLSKLGPCYGITFKMESTDKNAYGFLTPTYFALDGLAVQAQWAK